MPSRPRPGPAARRPRSPCASVRGRSSGTAATSGVACENPIASEPPVVQEGQEHGDQDEPLDRARRGPGVMTVARESKASRPGQPTLATRRSPRGRTEEQRRPAGPATQLADPPRPVAGAHGDRPGREGGPDRQEDEDPGPARRPDRRVEDGEGEDDDPGVLDRGVADDVLEVLLDPRRDRAEDEAGDADGHDDEVLDRQLAGRPARPGRSTRPPRPARRPPGPPGPRR